MQNQACPRGKRRDEMKIPLLKCEERMASRPVYMQMAKLAVQTSVILTSLARVVRSRQTNGRVYTTFHPSTCAYKFSYAKVARKTSDVLRIFYSIYKSCTNTSPNNDNEKNYTKANDFNKSTGNFRFKSRTASAAQTAESHQSSLDFPRERGHPRGAFPVRNRIRRPLVNAFTSSRGNSSSSSRPVPRS